MSSFCSFVFFYSSFLPFSPPPFPPSHLLTELVIHMPQKATITKPTVTPTTAGHTKSSALPQSHTSSLDRYTHGLTKERKVRRERAGERVRGTGGKEEEVRDIGTKFLSDTF